MEQNEIDHFHKFIAKIGSKNLDKGIIILNKKYLIDSIRYFILPKQLVIETFGLPSNNIKRLNLTKTTINQLTKELNKYDKKLSVVYNRSSKLNKI